MPRLLSYADAVRLLGGPQENKIIAALDKLAGGVLLGAAPAFPAALGLLGAKSEVVRLGHELVRTLSERRSGISRYGRTERLQAAHAVIVVTAYFETVPEDDLPFRLADLDLTKEEQLVVAGGDSWLMEGIPQPEPHDSHELFMEVLRGYYKELSITFTMFLEGLSLGEWLTPAQRRQVEHALDRAPELACARYEEQLRRLAAQFPEVAWWSGIREHQATRAEVRALAVALADLEQMLATVSTGRPPDPLRAALDREYRAVLRRPIADSGEVPAAIRLPTLGEAYVTPLFRVAEVDAVARPSDEAWWADRGIREDLQEFLTGYLTSPQAALAPLLVLGQPGSGKSVLTKVLAARLPAADFLAVRVVLRDVPATADIQDQVEYAVRSATGEQLQWPVLARSAADAMPVILLDGFDELLQATGVSHSDYLTRVARFQQREADQGRPVAVVVTSRVSVADRARPPWHTVALRLEPFDDARITAWLDVWNATNRDRAALAPATVLAHREMAEQPLLLLMLALYDADGNALQRLPADLLRSDLYERLLHDFAAREVAKHCPALTDDDLARAVEDELRTLSVVAFAMFNRGAQWVTVSDLDNDLPLLLGHRREEPPAPDMRARLHTSELVLGRFFFIHRAQASRDADRLETYEFLHATFGEYLVARLTWRVLRDTAALDAAARTSLAGLSVTDDLLHALLSFTPLSSSLLIMEFIAEFASTLGRSERESLTGLLLRLFRVVHAPRQPGRLDQYQPRTLAVPTRHAAYSANLVLLSTAVAGGIRASELFPAPQDPVNGWYGETLLWRSQLGVLHGRDSLVHALAVDRIWAGDRRDIQLSLGGGTYHPPSPDLRWSFHPSPASQGIVDYMRRRTHLQCGQVDDFLYHTVEPLLYLQEAVGLGVYSDEDGFSRTAVRALLDVWLLPHSDATPQQRHAAYRRCVRIARGLADPGQGAIVALLLDRLATDNDITPHQAADILAEVMWAGVDMVRLFRCVVAFLGRDPDGDQKLKEAVAFLSVKDMSAIEEWVRQRPAALRIALGLGPLVDTTGGGSSPPAS